MLVPAATPVAIPVDEPIVATPVDELLQVPPPVLVSVVVNPSQTVVVPPIADGNGLTVIASTAKQPPGSV